MEKVQLKNICRPKQWKTLTGKNLVPDGKYPVYGANGIIGYYNDYNHENETLMIGCRGTCGALNISQPFSYINGNAMALDDLVDDIDIRYLYYALMGRGFQDVISGAVQPQIIRADLEKMEVWIGNKKEQKEIVDVFSKLDAVLSHRKREIQYLDDLIKARFVEMFGTLHDNKKGFAVVTIEKVCSLIKDGTHQTPQYTEDKEEGYKFLSSKDVMTQKIDWTDIKYIPAELHEKLYASIKPQRNDILMSKNGVNYGVAAVNDTDEVFDIYVSLALLRPKPMIDPVFFRCVINNHETKRQFDSSIKGIGVPNLHLGEIKKTKIILPPLELQKEFVSFVAQVDKSKLLSGCRLFHSWAPENRDKPKHVGVPQRKTKVLRGGRRQQ